MVLAQLWWPRSCSGGGARTRDQEPAHNAECGADNSSVSAASPFSVNSTGVTHLQHTDLSRLHLVCGVGKCLQLSNSCIWSTGNSGRIASHEAENHGTESDVPVFSSMLLRTENAWQLVITCTVDKLLLVKFADRHATLSWLQCMPRE